MSEDTHRHDRLRVLLVDDNELMLECAIGTLSSSACVIVGALRDGKAALEWIGAVQPDVVVLDISMPGMTGLEVASHLRRSGSTVPIVFLTVHDDEEFVRAAYAAGATGYVLKRRLTTDLLTAIVEACAGREWMSPVPALKQSRVLTPVAQSRRK